MTYCEEKPGEPVALRAELNMCKSIMLNHRYWMLSVEFPKALFQDPCCCSFCRLIMDVQFPNPFDSQMTHILLCCGENLEQPLDTVGDEVKKVESRFDTNEPTINFQRKTRRILIKFKQIFEKTVLNRWWTGWTGIKWFSTGLVGCLNWPVMPLLSPWQRFVFSCFALNVHLWMKYKKRVGREISFTFPFTSYDLLKEH